MNLLSKLFVVCAMLATLAVVQVVEAADLSSRNMGQEIAKLHLASAETAANTLPQLNEAAAPATSKAVAKDMVLKGDAKCTACHDEADSPQLL